jgi:hypothetical protein
MEKIIAGNFQTSVQADKARQALLKAGFPDDDISIYHNNAPGQHGADPLGGDEHADPQAKGAAGGAAAGSLAGAVAGAAVGGAVGGALGAVAGAGVGAYTGSFGGAMVGAGENGNLPPQRRPAGIVVAVRLEDNGLRDSVISTLSELQPVAIEEAEGEWQHGEWSDFDPVAAPNIVWRANGNSEEKEKD